MTNVITIYLFLGVAYWAAHVIQCEGCKRSIALLTGSFFEGALHVFGWPFLVIEYLLAFKKPKNEDEYGPVTEDILKMSIVQREGESSEDFQKRIGQLISERIEQARRELQK